MCKGVLYIDLRKNKVGIVRIDTVRKDFKSYTKKNLEKAKLSRTMQSMIRHHSNKYYKINESKRS